MDIILFLNHDANVVVSELLKVNPKRFSDRNKFDNYVFATDFQRDQAIELGLSKKIAVSLGSVRFSYKWHKILKKIEKKPKDSNDKINICLMTHWSYNVDKEETFKMIESISCIDDIILYIKPHTRESGSISSSKVNNFKDNIKYIANETSFELIRKTDIVIAFGSSIIF